MTSTTPDVIDLLVGIAPGSALDQIRAARQQARDNAQASYLALFEPAETADASLEERFAIACFVTGLHGQEKEAAFYRQGLDQVAKTPGLAAAIGAEVGRGMAEGPAGHFPPGPLSAEDSEGAVYPAPAEARAALGNRIAAALEHAHLLVIRPRDASAAALQSLLDAGWSATGIVTLSQLVAFLSFQLRVIHGLRVLAKTAH
jgi:CMD domain protein